MVTQNLDWKCVYCDNFTDYTSDRCSVCDGLNINPYNEDDIFENSDNEFPSNETKPTTDSVSDHWKCNYCSSLNSYAKEMCSYCDKRGTVNNIWTCVACTKINENGVDNCIICFELNPFRKPCPRCDKMVIDVRFSGQCDECINKGNAIKPEPVNNVSDRIDSGNRTETWACLQCTFKNSLNSITCDVCNNPDPITHNTWQCGSCTLSNDTRLNNCGACGAIKATEERKLNFSITFDEFDQLAAITMKPMGDILKFAKLPNSEKSLCRICQRDLRNNDVEQICKRCENDYYVCKNNGCGMLVEKSKISCTKCGNVVLKKIPFTKPPERGWQCSWKDCGIINEMNHDLCVECSCFRDLNDFKEECLVCGWIKLNSAKCRKCGS